MRLFLRDWQIAYRRLPKGSIFSDNVTPFIPVPNTKRYLAADPFIFNYCGKKYLFAELLDKTDNLGKIGYAEWNGERFGEWRVVINEPYHLSYPNIFEYNGNVYIVPEANQSNEIYAYEAVEFPNRWKKCEPILSGKRCVDTTFLNIGGKHLMFTYDIIPDSDKKLWLYEIDEAGKIDNGRVISHDDKTARCGGNFICMNNDTYRVSQDCGVDYGVAVVFSKVKEYSTENYEEELCKRITTSDIVIKGIHHAPCMHTYNADDELEVIDMHVTNYSLSRQIQRITDKIKKMRK